MAKVVVTFRDGKKKGEVTVTAYFDPSIKGNTGTPAQYAAVELLTVAKGKAKG